jgi:predicted RNase H-like HicB family nuclease
MPPQIASHIDHWAHAAIKRAEYEQMNDGRWFARVPGCAGAVAVADTRDNAESGLFSVLEDWALLGLRLGDEIPEFDGENLNTDEARHLAS